VARSDTAEAAEEEEANAMREFCVEEGSKYHVKIIECVALLGVSAACYMVGNSLGVACTSRTCLQQITRYDRYLQLVLQTRNLQASAN
jgi:hypothetical protein